MPVFVHLTSHRNLTSIRRSGIGLRKKRWRASGVFAMPVTRNFYVSHQWLRELRRWRSGNVYAVYFRLGDDEQVWIGHYGQPHVLMTANQAVALVMGAEHLAPGTPRHKRAKQRLHNPPEGYEVIVPRKILASEIIRFRGLKQVTGWRYMPGANGTPPCTCLCCGGKGSYGIQRMLRAVEQSEATGKPTKVVVSGRGDASYRRVEQIKQRLKAKG